MEPQEQIKRKRGRPRKNPQPQLPNRERETVNLAIGTRDRVMVIANRWKRSKADTLKRMIEMQLEVIEAATNAN